MATLHSNKIFSCFALVKWCTWDLCTCTWDMKQMCHSMQTRPLTIILLILFFLIPFRRIQMHLKHQANLKVCPKKICWNYWKSKPTTQRNLRERLKVQYKNLIISKLKLFSKLLILIISILIFGLLILQSFRTKFSLKEWKGWKSTIGRWNEGMDFSRSFSWVW